jgi:hypothetical protein
VIDAAESTSERLLAQAEIASSHGQYALAARDLALLRASAGSNQALAPYIAGVQRRLQYAGIAGAP